MLRAIQVGMNTADLAGSLRLYSEAIGFQNAGGQAIWGSTIEIQGLPPESRALMWWMVGRQPFFQLEFFQHSVPTQRPLAADWRPSDCGWVRIGIKVPQFDQCLAALETQGVSLLAPPARRDGSRRAAFRDPHVGVIVEVMEDQAGGDSDERPALAYATSSVTDLAGARTYYEQGFGLEVLPLDSLHLPEDEALWGLDGASREGFLARAGDVLLEVVAYRTPEPRSRPADYRLSDQGIVNVALGAHEAATIQSAMDQVARLGWKPPYLVRNEGVLAGYIIDPEREIELVSIPREFQDVLGFVPAAPFFS